MVCAFSTREAPGSVRPDSVLSLAARTPIGEVMEPIRCVQSDARLAGLPLTAYAGPFVVVDLRGVPLGAVRSAEVLREHSLVAHARASDLMVPVLTVGEREPLSKALALMGTDRVRHACVVDDEQIATGLISDLTALQWLTRRLQVLAAAEG